MRLLRLCGFVLDVHLERYDDGLRDDWHQAQRLLAMTPEERLDTNTRLVAVASDLRAAARASGDA